MRNYFYLILVCIPFQIYSQTNLILNGSFENNFDFWGTEDAPFIAGDPFLSTYCWNEYFSQACVPMYLRSIEPTTNYFGIQLPFEGEKYAGLIAKHVHAPGTPASSDSWHKGRIGFNFSTPLLKGNFYILKFRVSKADNSWNNPNLKIYLNNEFSDPITNFERIYSKKKTDDGSPSNVNWEEVIVRFPVLDDGYDWLIFKVNNAFTLKSSWAALYLDDIQLYEECDYFANVTEENCLYSFGTMNVTAHPLSTSGPLYHWSESPEQFHISDIAEVNHIKIRIFPLNGASPIRTIEKWSTNGFPHSIWWDGKTESGAEAAAAWYIADVDAWRGIGSCNHINKTFHFIKLNGTEEHTEAIIDPFPNTIYNGPVYYKYCCLSDMTINNSHFTIHDNYGTSTFGLAVYQAKNKIIFGPDVSTDVNTSIFLVAPNVINLTAPLNIKGSLYTIFDECVFRRRNPFMISVKDSLETGNDYLAQIITFPNPTSTGIFSLSFIKPELDINNVNVSIFNSLGMEIEFNLTKELNKITIDLRDNQRGIYFVQLKNNDQIKSVKLMYF